MHGMPVAKSKLEPLGGPQKILLTPDLATSLLERNQLNRPLSDQHVKRLANQIKTGKWRFNGDTIKLSSTEEVLDGQHRLWAVIESKISVETIIVYGIDKDAFSTIDTLRKPRSGGDVIALAGRTSHRNTIATSLAWMMRYQRGVLAEYRAPQNKIENSDIEEAFAHHPGMGRAVERCLAIRAVVSTPVIAFAYYVITNRNPGLAERMVHTLQNPAGVGIDDPFYRLRIYLTAWSGKQKDPVMTIALIIKAANAAFKGSEIKQLSWRAQGEHPEAFPVLAVK